MKDPPAIELTRNEAIDLTALLADVEIALEETNWQTIALAVTEWREELEHRLWPEWR